MMKKIAIVSMPRTASKMVIGNFASYTVAKFGNVSKLLLDDGIVRNCTDEFLNPGFQELFAGKAKLLDTGDVRITAEAFDSLDQELIDRVWIFNQISKPAVLKYFPFSKYMSITDSVLDRVDNIYYLGRKDLFSHVLSCCISYQTNSWIANKIQENIIRDKIQNKISIPPELFRTVLKEFQHYSNICIGKSVFEFDNIIQMRDAKDFCNMFKLEFVEFKFSNSDLEFTDNKELMINNIDELRKIMEDDTERPQSLP